MLYHDLVAAGVPLDHHESDLYCPVTEATRALIEHHGLHATTFINQLNGEHWFDVPFAYLPWWEAKSR